MTTIIGAGGLGKTRLAHLLGREAEQSVVHFVELVAFLVATTRDLRVLTTSRAPLNIAAERVYPLGQLGRTDADEPFRARALAARPAATLDDTAVSEVVSRLDGLPLAIELAAAKVRMMSVEDIGRRLGNRFTLLRGGDRSAADRNQTLLAVIDWSWNLLTESERDALRRLSVFQDGFTLSTAESILGDGALESVQGLVDQSLLRVRDSAAAEDSTRFGVLETVREFGWMQLLDAGMDAEALAAQRRWARDYAGGPGLELFGHGQIAAMNALRAEETNLTDVLRAALAEQEPETVTILLAALAGYWNIRGEHLRILMLADSIQNAVRGWTPPSELADHARLAFATVLSNTAMLPDVNHADVRELLRALGPHSTRPRINALTTVTLATEPDDPAGNADRLARLCTDTDPHIARLAFQGHAHNLENSGDPTAVEAAGKALALVTSDDGPWYAATQHTQLAQLHAQFGNLDKAAEHAELALPVLRQLDATDDTIQLRGILAIAATIRGRFEQARQTIAEITHDQQRRSQYGGGSIVVATSEAELMLARGRPAEGLRSYRQSVEQLRHARPPGFPELRGFEPWTLYVEAVALNAHALCGEPDEGSELFHTLREKLPALLTPDRDHIDFPVTGTVLFGLGTWGLAHRELPAGDAVRLVMLADRFSYNRTAPTMALGNATELAENTAPGLLDEIAVEYADRRGPQLLDEARRAVEQLP